MPANRDLMETGPKCNCPDRWPYRCKSRRTIAPPTQKQHDKNRPGVKPWTSAANPWQGTLWCASLPKARAADRRWRNVPWRRWNAGMDGRGGPGYAVPVKRIYYLTGDFFLIYYFHKMTR
jgi:hypothetical protein